MVGYGRVPDIGTDDARRRIHNVCHICDGRHNGLKIFQPNPLHPINYFLNNLSRICKSCKLDSFILNVKCRRSIY